MDEPNELMIKMLVEIRDQLVALNEADNERREKHRRANRRYRERQRVISHADSVISPKESEKSEGRKEDIPPTPPIGEKREEKKAKEKTPPPPRSNARGGAENTNESVVEAKPTECIDVLTPPNLEKLLVWTKSRGYKDEQFTRQWFDYMTNDLYWLDPKTGGPIAHWSSYYRGCLRVHQLEAKRAAATAKRNAKSGAPEIGAIKHGANWRGTRKEDIGNVLG